MLSTQNNANDFEGVGDKTTLELVTNSESKYGVLHLKAVSDGFPDIYSYAYEKSKINYNGREIRKMLDKMSSSIRKEIKTNYSMYIRHQLVDKISVRGEDFMIFYTESETTWFEANQLCMSYGYQLPQLTNDMYQENLLALIKRAIWLKPMRAVYIGLYRQVSINYVNLIIRCN